MTKPQFTDNTLELVCRTCLKDCTTYFDIFNSKKNNMVIVDILVSCTSLEVQKEDGFPINICSDCMEKLSSAFDFKIMVIESNSKLHELRQNVTMEKEGGLDNNYMENIPTNKEFIKIEETIITDLRCNNEDDLGHQANKEEIQVKLVFESLEENDGYLGDFPSRSPADSSKPGNREGVPQTTPIADLHQNDDGRQYRASDGTMDTEKGSKSESLNEIYYVSDVSADAALEYPRETRTRERKLGTRSVTKKPINYKNKDEKNAALLNNPDFQRIMSGGLTKSQKMGKTVFCTECNKTYSYRYYIKKHAYVHTGKNPYRCGKCEKCVPGKYKHKEHMRSNSKTRDFACDVCGKTFTLRQHLKRHKVELHSEERPYKCNVCDRYFKRSSTLTRHASSHKVQDCDICGKGFVSRRRLREHKRNHLIDKKFVCTKCGSAFPHESSLQWHLKMHRSEDPSILRGIWHNDDPLVNQAGKPAMDVEAQLRFESPDKTGEVANVPAGISLSSEDLIRTEECERRIPSPPVTKLKKRVNNFDEKHAKLLGNPDYLRIINGGLTPEQRSRETVFCTECDRTFNYRYYISMHAYIHTGRVPYKCDKCEKCYPKKYLLKRHVRSHLKRREQKSKRHENSTHSKERPYKCNVCDKSFVRSWNLTSHTFTHTTDKQYICKICGMTFVNKSRLSFHKKQHTSKKKFDCIKCGTTCSDKDILKEHVRTHIGEKSHACQYCDKRFLHETSLRRHVRAHAVVTSNECKICSRIFKSSYKMQRHMHVHTVYAGETVSV